MSGSDSDTQNNIHNPDKLPPSGADKNLPSTSRRVNGHDHTPPPAVQQNPILLVDSDITSVVAQQYLPPGWHCTAYDPARVTSLGSATHAVIWGRNDEGGKAWAEAVADAVGLPSHIVHLPRLPPHWRIGDPLPAGRSSKQLTAYLAGAVAKCYQRLTQPAQVPQQRANGVHKPAAVPAAPAAAPIITTPPQDITDLPYIRSGARGDGAIKPLMKNAVMLLQANPHRWDLRFNEFSHRAFLGADPLDDQDIYRIVEWVQWCGVHASTGVITEAIHAVATQNRFHPVKTYLDPLVWDEIPRLDMLFIDHAGTPDSPLTRAMTSRWFIQSIARIYQPGCQADATLILEGTQGLRKSSLFRELFGDQWFTDHLPDLTSKDALIQLRGVWCIEISELATLGRADIKKINQFLTSRVDRYRDPYGRVVADFPRACVFAGTVNPGAGGYLKDETGARRFWPLAINESIDLGAVAGNRDQIWAEALHRYRAGEPWYLDRSELMTAAQAATMERFASDPWQEKIEDFVKRREEVTMEDIFRMALRVDDVSKWNPQDQNRIARCLAFAGWMREQRGAGRWVYVRAVGEMGADPEQPALL